MAVAENPEKYTKQTFFILHWLVSAKNFNSSQFTNISEKEKPEESIVYLLLPLPAGFGLLNPLILFGGCGTFFFSRCSLVSIIINIDKNTKTRQLIISQRQRYRITLYKLCAFPVRICIPGEAHHHSKWGWITMEWTSSSTGIHILTGNGDVPHQEWGCTSPGTHILPGMGMCLTGNAHSSYKVRIVQRAFKSCVVLWEGKGTRVKLLQNNIYMLG